MPKLSGYRAYWTHSSPRILPYKLTNGKANPSLSQQQVLCFVFFISILSWQNPPMSCSYMISSSMKTKHIYSSICMYSLQVKWPGSALYNSTCMTQTLGMGRGEGWSCWVGEFTSIIIVMRRC